MKRVILGILIAGFLHAGSIVINEVSLGNLKWVELYNTTSQSINLNGWKIRNSSGEDDLNGIIRPHSYFLIVSYLSDFYAVYPDVSCPKYEPADHTIGSGLRRSADMLQLIDSDGNVVDQINWGTPDPSWPNYTVSLWYPGILLNSDILARIPNGRDRNASTDWRVPSHATPGNPNPVMSGLDSSSWGKIKALFGASGGKFL